MDVIEEFYKSAEKKSKQEKYPSTLKLKLPVKVSGEKNIPQFDIYNDSKELVNIVNCNEIDLSCLEKGSDIIGIICKCLFVGKTNLVLQLYNFKHLKHKN